MKNKNLIAISMLSALLVPAFAPAATGFYIDGAVGQASVDEQGIDDSDSAYRIGAGWRFLENFGAEIGYVDLGTVSEAVAIGGATASLSADGLSAGIAGKIPLSDASNGFYLSARGGMYWWDATGRARIGNTTVEITDSSNDFYVGIGGGYDFNEQFSLGVGFDRYQIDDNNADASYDILSVAGEVRF